MNWKEFGYYIAIVVIAIIVAKIANDKIVDPLVAKM